MVKLIRSLTDAAGFVISDLPKREEPKNALLCDPRYFDVIDVKNAHMAGQLGKIDFGKSRRQWEALRSEIENDGRTAYVLNPTEMLEDMVFTANPVLPGLSLRGEKIVLLSNMRHPSRQLEVAAHENWFRSHGYQVFRLGQPTLNFEGQGDALWHPHRRLLWGGFGFRTSPDVYSEVSRIFETSVILLELSVDHFYHLDTCLCPLSETEALYTPGAFKKEGEELIRKFFPEAIEVSKEEALGGFACNALPLGRKVLIQRGSPKTNEALRQRGYEVVELDTSEYMKSGGSVFCMKMMVY